MEEEFSRLTRLPAYVFNITTELKAAARKRGEDIIDFGMGNPDGATPKHIVDKMVEAAQRPATHRYSVSKGVPRLRKAICGWYKRRYDVDLDPMTESIVTIGSKEGIAHLCMATMDRGDVVVVPNPSYPIHIYGPIIAGANIRSVAVHNTDDFLAELEHSIPLMYPRPKMLILNFPANPTTPVRRSAVPRARRGPVPRTRDLPRARPRLRGHHLRRLQGSQRAPGARRQRDRGRVLHPVEELQHARMARRLHGREPDAGRPRSAGIKSYFDYGMFTPIQVASILALEGPQECVTEICRELPPPPRLPGAAGCIRQDGM